MMRDSSITSTVDFEADGIQHGHLKLPHSHDGSAWGAIMIPVAVIRNGVRWRCSISRAVSIPGNCAAGSSSCR
jgi:predicted deacylase